MVLKIVSYFVSKGIAHHILTHNKVKIHLYYLKYKHLSFKSTVQNNIH